MLSIPVSIQGSFVMWSLKLFNFEIFAENTDLHEAFVIILRYKDYPEENVLLCIHGSITSFPKQIHVVEEKNKNV